MAERPFHTDIVRQEGFRFDVVFDNERWPHLVVDEPEPLGEDRGPNAARLLAGAVGNCLAASLLMCMEKARVPPVELSARVEGSMVRNDDGRMRIDELRVTVRPTLEGDGTSPRLDRCLDIFEDFCVVTQSVREGIDVAVHVDPQWVEASSDGAPLTRDRPARPRTSGR